MKRKEAVYKGLEFVPVYFEDNSLTSPDYFQITEFPTRLTAGKNLFKLRGHPTNLRVGGVLNLEVLDYNGDPIYTEVVDYIDEDKSRVIAIYIYTETSPGDCTITLISEAQTINGQSVPQEWQGRPNLRWSRTVPVNPNVSNVSEIIFSKIPQITVSEQVGVQLDRIYSGSQQFPTYTTGTVRLFTLNGTPAIELIGGKFTGDMQTGTITVATPQNSTPTPNYPAVSTPYVSTIKKVLSDTTALLDREYTVYSSQSIFPHTYTEFAASSYSLTYEQTPTYVATENSQSFALLQIKGLEPATGDVSRIKVYTNNKGTVGTWELVNDVELEETEIFVTSTASLFPDQSIGTFTSQSIINTYWDGFTYTGKTTGTAPTLTWSTASLNNAMNIASATNISNQNAVLVVQNKSAYNGVFIATSSYKVTIDALGTRDATGLNPKLSVYVSGSAVAFDPTDYFNQELPKILGKRIGELEVTSDSQRFDDTVFNFESNYDGTGALLFVVESGQWQIADVRTTTDNDAGYSPNYTRIRSIIETPHKANNQISFKVEYYNVDGVVSKQTSYLYDNVWQGGNRYIDGDYSMLTGSLYVADSLESGVAISGYKNSGFVRSLGYQGFDAGFPGFLLWSGSALQGQNTKGGVPYSGVGLELYLNTASYFRYSTSDDEIYVATDNFFFGNPNTAYISGSNGVLEISSSNFLLSSSGDVFANDATFTGVALANIIRDKTVIVTTANSSSYLQNFTAGDGAATPAYRVVLDGSLGGERVRRVRIDCSLLRPIGDFKLPNIGSNEKLDFVIETSEADTKLLDIFTTDRIGLSPAVYDQITLKPESTFTLTTGGGGGSNILQTAGTHHPFTHEFQRDVAIGDGDTDGGQLTISGSNSLVSTTATRPRIILDNSNLDTNLRLHAARNTTTTSTLIGARTLGNLLGHYQISPGVNAIEPYIAMSASSDTNDRRVAIIAGLHTSFRTLTADATVSISDHFIEDTNATGGTHIITLPGAVGIEAGRQLFIVKSTNTGTLQIAASGSDVIVRPNGQSAATRSTTNQYGMIQLFCNGAGEWYGIETGTWT